MNFTLVIIQLYNANIDSPSLTDSTNLSKKSIENYALLIEKSG